MEVDSSSTAWWYVYWCKCILVIYLLILYCILWPHKDRWQVEAAVMQWSLFSRTLSDPVGFRQSHPSQQASHLPPRCLNSHFSHAHGNKSTEQENDAVLLTVVRLWGWWHVAPHSGTSLNRLNQLYTNCKSANRQPTQPGAPPPGAVSSTPSAWRSTVLVCASTPLTQSTTTKAPSAKRAAVETSRQHFVHSSGRRDAVEARRDSGVRKCSSVRNCTTKYNKETKKARSTRDTKGMRKRTREHSLQPSKSMTTFCCKSRGTMP